MSATSHLAGGQSSETLTLILHWDWLYTSMDSFVLPASIFWWRQSYFGLQPRWHLMDLPFNCTDALIGASAMTEQWCDSHANATWLYHTHQPSGWLLHVSLLTTATSPRASSDPGNSLSCAFPVPGSGCWTSPQKVFLGLINLSSCLKNHWLQLQALNIPEPEEVHK